ncbi:molybdenum cofactor guanylyltransferase MobA [Ochrobactrum sp. Q0168]|uniref:molybdenum cofactor guanylyltransferase MobA n=1 Tax=Ochrobactrum sp. Q0168 TaxID=2793241 RepID=UPI003530128E
MMAIKQDVVGAIIAGGLSSRMREGGIAGDKFLQALGSSSIIAAVAARLKPQVDALFINANGDPSRLADLGQPIVADIPANHGGPLAGILTALIRARNSTWLLTAAADTPFLPANLAEQLFERQRQSGKDIVLASSVGHVHPVFGLWRTQLADRLRDWLSTAEKASVLAFARDVKFETVDFPLATTKVGSESYDPFFNINRPIDLVEARRLNRLNGALP